MELKRVEKSIGSTLIHFPTEVKMNLMACLKSYTNLISRNPDKLFNFFYTNPKRLRKKKG